MLLFRHIQWGAPTFTNSKNSSFWNTVMNSAPKNRKHGSLQHHRRAACSRCGNNDGNKRLGFAFGKATVRAAVAEAEGHRGCECRQIFRISVDLESHKKAKHPKQSRSNEIDRCMLEFTQWSHLHQHVRSMHEQIRSYVCGKCDMPFAERFAIFPTVTPFPASTVRRGSQTNQISLATSKSCTL